MVKVHVFDRQGQWKQTISIDPPDQKSATWRVTDIDFTRDPGQTHMFVMDLGSGKVRILERKSGREVERNARSKGQGRARQSSVERIKG